MEKYEFKAKCPSSMWIAGILFIVTVTLYGILMHKYELTIMWGVFIIVFFIGSIRTFTITPDCFSVKPGLTKAKTFLLKDIVVVERKFTKEGKPKSIIIRYMHSGVPHNFVEIRKANADIEGILGAILDFHPAVKII